MEAYSIFVRDLQARTLCLSVTSSECLSDLKASLQEATGIPSEELYITARHGLDDSTPLAEQGVTADMTLHLSARLRGGKGGFGSLLRGSGKTAMTENEDACRDLSGRRLRLVNADKKLQDWAAGEKQRQDDKQAAKEERERAKAETRAEETHVDLEAIRKDQNAVISSVAKALESHRKSNLKRPAEGKKPAQVIAKKSRYSSDSEEDSASESEEEDDQTEALKEEISLTNSGGPTTRIVTAAVTKSGNTAAAVQIVT